MTPTNPSPTELSADEARDALLGRLRTLAERLDALDATGAATLVREAAWEIEGAPRPGDPWVWKPTTVQPFQDGILTIYVKPGTRVQDPAHYATLLASTLATLIAQHDGGADAATLVVDRMPWAWPALGQESTPEVLAQAIIDALGEIPGSINQIDWSVEARHARPMTADERAVWQDQSLAEWAEAL